MINSMKILCNYMGDVPGEYRIGGVPVNGPGAVQVRTTASCGIIVVDLAVNAFPSLYMDSKDKKTNPHCDKY